MAWIPAFPLTLTHTFTFPACEILMSPFFSPSSFTQRILLSSKQARRALITRALGVQTTVQAREQVLILEAMQRAALTTPPEANPFP